MVLYHTILKPELVEFYIKNEDANQNKADYALFKSIYFEEEATAVYLRRIRFIVAYDSSNEQYKYLEVPYQFHLRFVDNCTAPYHDGGVAQNTMHHDVATGVLMRYPTPSTTTAHYSTFCIQLLASRFPRKSHDIPEGSLYLHHQTDWVFYDMERSVLLKTGAMRSMTFEIFFTNLEGQRYYRYIPNVELEFEVV